MTTLVEIGLWNAATAAVLALLAAAVSRLVRRPALTHTLWILVILKLVTPPLVPFSLPWFGEQEVRPPVEGPRPAPVEESEPLPIVVEDAPRVAVIDDRDASAPISVEPPAPPAAPPVPFPWRWWTSVIWLTGSALWVVWAAYHVVRFRRVLRRARLASGPLQAEAEALAQRLGLRRCPDVWLVPGAVSPMIWSLGRRPCLLFPAGLLEQLDEAGRAALLAHELAHVRRRDHWLRLLELAATGLYWWNPVLWWARRELHEAEEQCCDAWGVWALGGDGRPYALALLQAVAFVSQARLPLPAGASGSVGQVSHLKRRLAMILQGQTSRSLSWVGFCVVLGAAVLLLPLFPALGQPPAGVPDLPRGTTPPARNDPRSNRDAEIERLKLRLDQLIRDKAGEPDKAKEVDVLSARVLQEELAKTEAVIAAKTNELKALQDRATMLRGKLKEVEGRRDTSRATPAVAPGGIPARPSRVDDLEKKLDMLQKQLEELRREMKRGTGTESVPVPPGRRAREGADLPLPAVPGTTPSVDPARR